MKGMISILLRILVVVNCSFVATVDADLVRSNLRKNKVIDERFLGTTPVELFVSPLGNDSNDGRSRDSPLLTLSKASQVAIANGASTVGGSIYLMKGRHIWNEEDGVVQGLIGPSSTNPFHIKADDSMIGDDVLLDGSDLLPPLSKWEQKSGGKYCTGPDFHPVKQVHELWFTGIESITGGENVLGVQAQHPNAIGHQDAIESWPIPDDPEARDYPLPGSMWDKSARLGNNEGGTLGLIECEAVVLSPPPKCFLPEGFELTGNRCTPGCQQITGANVEPASSRCPLGLQDCPERYHEAFTPHPDPKNPNAVMNNCPAAFPSCDRNDKEKNWPDCLNLHNIGYIHDPNTDMDYSSSGGEIYVTACVDKKLLGPFPIVGHDKPEGKIYFDYTDLSVNKDKPGKQTPLWEGMTSCWKMDADKIEDITDGAVKTDYFRMEEEPKYKVVSRDAFDNSLEWWHDGPEEKLCVKVLPDDAVKLRGVRVKQRGSMLRLIGSENVKISGLKLFATEFQAESQDGVGFGLSFDKMSVEYFEEIHLNPAAVTNSIFYYGKAIIKTTGPVSGSNKKPTRCTFTNNLVAYSEMGIEITDCAGSDITHNTIHHIYNGDALEIYKHGCDNYEWINEQCRFEVAYNRIHDIGFNGHCDCSGVQTKFGAVKDMQLHHNWIYSLPYHKGIRLDTGENGASIYENVIWNAAKGATFKGGVLEGNQIIHNTAFGSKDNDFSVLEYELGTGSTTPWKPYNTKSIVYNNAVDDWRDSGKRKCTEPACVESPGYALKAPKLSKPWIKRWEKCPVDGPIPCHNNWKDLSFWLEEYNLKTETWVATGVHVSDQGCQSGPLGKFNSLNYGTCTEGKLDWSASGSWPKVHTMLRSVGHYDFRPKGALVGNGKSNIPLGSNDIGAYEASDTYYNIPGRLETFASSPVPADGSFNVETTADLMFLGGKSAVKYRVYFSTSFCAVASGEITYTELLFPNNIFSPEHDLEMGSQYYWRVDAVQEDGTITEGSIWCFDVIESSTSINLSTTWNGRTNKAQCTMMNIHDHCGSCQDDNTFMFDDIPDKTCSNWAKKRPVKRCDMIDDKGRHVKDYCISTCNNCHDETPTRSPTLSDDCNDDESFMFDGDSEKTCEWVLEKKTKKRCKQIDSFGSLVEDFCPLSCGKCQQTRQPSTSPSSSPTVAFVCEDDDNYRWKGKPERNCEWVSRQANDRCMKEDSSGFAYEFCKETCNQC